MSQDPKAYLPPWVDPSRVGCGAGDDFAYDPYLSLDRGFEDSLFIELRSTLDGARLRARRDADAANASRVLGSVIANGLMALTRGPRTRVHYSRGKATYVGVTPYRPAWLSSKLLLNVVDRLDSAGLLITLRASPGPFAGSGLHRSTYELAPALLELLERHGCSAANVERDDAHAAVVFLFDEKLSLQSYDPTASEVAGKIAVLRAWNSHVASVEIGFNCPRDQLGVGYPDISRKSLYRLFKGSFELHGRFYGGWWQNVPKRLRPLITIGGGPTVELDYSAMHPRMIYHQEGLDFRGDPYEVQEIRSAADASAAKWDAVRPVVKTVFAFILNAKKRGGYVSDAFSNWPSGISKADGVKAIEAMHAPIKDNFFRGQSLSLMFLDSEVCAGVMTRAVRDGVTVLPIHDSFIVRQEHEDWLCAAMKDSYREKMGFDPVIA